MHRRFRIIFRVDASEEIGTGHVIRCLTLAERLRRQDAEVHFICREFEGNLCDLIIDRGFKLHRLPRPVSKLQTCEGPKHAAWVGVPWRQDAEQTSAIIAALPEPNWIVVDHYGLDRRWEETFRATGAKILAIDDLADRHHACDLLLDQNLVADMAGRYTARVPEKCTLLLGPTYALLQDEYRQLRPRTPPREGAIRRLLVSFGGVDNDGLTEKTVRALLHLNSPTVEADIVLSSISPQFPRIAQQVSGRPQYRLHDRVPSLAPLMLAADLAIGASGTTNWERLCLGLPALVVTVADNQQLIADELANRQLIRWLGNARQVDQAQIQNALAQLFSAGLDRSWSERCLEVVDGRGADRVCAVLLAHPNMEFSVRHAEVRDEALLLEWTNDPVTRRNAFSSRQITPAEHRFWFRSRLRNPKNCVIYVIETTSGIPLGQVRFDRRGNEWEISYAVAPLFRGRGVGRAMLSSAIDAFRSGNANVDLFGQVKVGNSASARIFEALNFEARASQPDRNIYQLSYGR